MKLEQIVIQVGTTGLKLPIDLFGIDTAIYFFQQMRAAEEFRRRMFEVAMTRRESGWLK